MATNKTLPTDAEAGRLAGDDLASYDLTRQWMRTALTGRLPAAVDFEGTLDSYAYWACSVVRRHNAEWETTVQEYIDRALRDAAQETEAEHAEFALLHRSLREGQAQGLLLDVGAGWGRMASLYAETGWRPVYLEPSDLGVRLMRRNGLPRIARAPGERLPFGAATFCAVLIGWVLHHHSENLDAKAIVREAARVLAPGGRFFSIEPLGPGFDMARWRELLADAGITACATHEVYRMPTGQGEFELTSLLIGQKSSPGSEIDEAIP